MEVPFFTPVREYHERKAEFDKALHTVLERGDFINGTDCRELEKEIAIYTKSKHCIGVGNGSDALLIAGQACGWKKGDEVLTPAFTFFASASCASLNGAKPVFTDVDSDTVCMDMNDAANKINEHTRGIVPVHLFAQMADMNKCLEISHLNDAKGGHIDIIEDAAEAFGMKQEITVNVKREIKVAGTIGDFGVYSFFPTKTLGGYGDGGMMLTNNDVLFDKARFLRVHGATYKYHNEWVGYNSRLDTMQAAILRVKLQKIDEQIAKRQSHANQYYEELGELSEKGFIRLPKIKEGNTPVYYVFNIFAENKDGKTRDDLDNCLKENGIGTTIYYPVPLHLQKCFEELGYKKGDLPVSEKLCNEALALPMYPELTSDEISYVCEKIREYFKK